MAQKLIGREFERKELDRCLKSDKSEFVVVYGRRRIGKTFLIEQHFKKKFDFWFVGTRGLQSKEQLRNFAEALSEYSGIKGYKFKDWLDAFSALRQYLKTLSKRKKLVVFIDEMPWIDSGKSNFVPALEYFWNGWAMSQDNVMLIATGSSTSWMRDKIIANRGGLHGRITSRIHLNPFTLYESEKYLRSMGIKWDRYQTLQSYMLLGGVPYYYSVLTPELSLTQNVDLLFFKHDGKLRGEFDELYNALFTHAELYIEIVKLLCEHKFGLTYQEISDSIKKDGGNISKALKNLERCDFIEKWPQFGNKKYKEIYRLTDFYSLFYYKFIDQNNTHDEQWWSKNFTSQSISSWMGICFEMICLKHHRQIKDALGLAVISTETSTWKYIPPKNSGEQGAQIDMVIERADRIIHLCEIKFWKDKFQIKKDYDLQLRERMRLFESQLKTKKTLLNTFITTFGVANASGHSIVDSELTMDDLFRP